MNGVGTRRRLHGGMRLPKHEPVTPKRILVECFPVLITLEGSTAEVHRPVLLAQSFPHRVPSIPLHQFWLQVSWCYLIVLM
jgi:hypothetical protein